MSRSIQRMDLGKGIEAIKRGRMAGRSRLVSSPFSSLRAQMYSPFSVFTDLEIFDRNSLTFGKAEGRFGGLSLFVKGDPLGRPHDFQEPLFLGGGDPACRHHQTPGGPQRFDFLKPDAVSLKFLFRRSFIASRARGMNPDGISSVPISKSSSDIKDLFNQDGLVKSPSAALRQSVAEERLAEPPDIGQPDELPLPSVLRTLH